MYFILQLIEVEVEVGSGTESYYNLKVTELDNKKRLEDFTSLET